MDNSHARMVELGIIARRIWGRRAYFQSSKIATKFQCDLNDRHIINADYVVTNKGIMVVWDDSYSPL